MLKNCSFVHNTECIQRQSKRKESTQFGSEIFKQFVNTFYSRNTAPCVRNNNPTGDESQELQVSKLMKDGLVQKLLKSDQGSSGSDTDSLDLAENRDVINLVIKKCHDAVIGTGFNAPSKRVIGRRVNASTIQNHKRRIERKRRRSISKSTSIMYRNGNTEKINIPGCSNIFGYACPRCDLGVQNNPEYIRQHFQLKHDGVLILSLGEMREAATVLSTENFQSSQKPNDIALEGRDITCNMFESSLKKTKLNSST